MKKRHCYTILLLCAMTLFASQAWANRLSSTADRDEIGLNETLNLRVIFEGDRVSGSPDFSGIAQNFDILNNQRYSQQSIVNGQISQSTEWRLTLAPKKTGQLLIPPFSLAGETSQPLKIKVNEPAVNTLSGKQDVFVETSVKPESGFVQQQFIVTYALYYNRNVDSLDMPDFQVEDSRVEALPRVDYQKTVGQQAYGVSEFRYAVFPDTSGSVTIPGQTWTIRTTDQASMSRFGLSGGRMKLHRAKTDTIILSVQAKPDNYPADQYWLPATDVTIEQQWSRDVSEFKVGEPITRTVTITAEGAGGEQLPSVFENISAEHFKFYPDKPKQDSDMNSNGVTGSRTESVAIVPTRSGELTLPEVVVTWWNTQTETIEYATLDAVTVNVSGTAPAADTAEPAAPPISSNDVSATPAIDSPPTPSDHTPWGWIIAAVASFLINLLLLGMLLRARSGRSSSTAVPQTSANVKASQALRDFKLACQARSAEQARTSLLAWVRLRFPNAPTTLKTIVQKSGSRELANQLHRLERHLFHDNTTEVDFNALEKAIAEFAGKIDADSSSNALESFYPRQQEVSA